MALSLPITASGGVDLSKITHGIESLVGFLPIIARFVPQLAPIVPFLPMIQGGLQMLEEIQANPQHDPAAIADIITKWLQQIAQNVQAAKAGAVPGAVPPPAMTTGD